MRRRQTRGLPRRERGRSGRSLSVQPAPRLRKEHQMLRLIFDARRTARTSLAILAAAVLLIAAAVLPARAAAAPAPKPTIVLVHGSYADASSWSAVIPALQKRGYPVVAAANPLRGLAEDSAYLQNTLAQIKGPIVLVGHSYGGMVISNAATGNPNVKALVYIAAFAPLEGETLQQLISHAPGSLLAPSTLGGGHLPDARRPARARGHRQAAAVPQDPRR